MEGFSMPVKRVPLLTDDEIKSPFWSRPPLLRSENAAEFDRIVQALARDIKPSGAVEEMLVSDIAYLVWDIRRFRRAMVGIVEGGLVGAIKRLVQELTGEQARTIFDDTMPSDEIALRYSSSRKVRLEVLELLSEFGLEESAFEAEAVRQRLNELETIEKILASLEERRNKTLAHIAVHRESFARRARESSDRLINVDATILSLEKPVNDDTGVARGNRAPDRR
jgi:hypothetical protein